MRWLAPDTLTSERALFTVRVPNEELIRDAVRGAVYSLVLPRLWIETATSVTPDEVAEAIQQVLGPLTYTIE